jgi:hypothetical protein
MVFQYKKDLIRHENRKTPCISVHETVVEVVNSHACEQCNKEYSTKQNLVRHQKTCNASPDMTEVNKLRKRVDMLEKALTTLLKLNQKVYIKTDPSFYKYLELFGEYPTDCVYFIKQVREEPRVKIGLTGDLKRRKNGLYTANSDVLEVIGFIETANMHELETQFQTALEDHRIAREWFEFTEDDIIDILTTYRETGEIEYNIDETDETDELIHLN